MTEHKILVVGPVLGQFTKAFTKINKLHAKQAFAFCLVTGDFFAADPPQKKDDEETVSSQNDNELQLLLSNKITLDVPTYFTLGNHAFPRSIQDKLSSNDANEIITNLHFLGRKGTLTTSEGIKIVFLGGRQVSATNEGSLTQSISPFDPLYLENEARILHGTNTTHILLTNQWPRDIEKGSFIPLPEDYSSSESSYSISNLCAHLKPRYHFCPSPSTKWEREAFMYPATYEDPSSSPAVVRFQALGDVNAAKNDFISAFKLDVTKPPDTSTAQRSAPFSPSRGRVKRRQNDDIDDRPLKFHHAQNDDNPNSIPNGSTESYRAQHNGERRGRKNKHQNRKPYNPSDCFMCFNNPSFDASMVISIGDTSFLTSLRGSLPTPTTFPQLQSSGNLMIIPHYHAADDIAHGQRSLSDRQAEFDEMSRYRHALQHMLADRNRSNSSEELGAVCWEVNRTGIRHFHWQWIACPTHLISKGLVEAAFKLAGEKNQHELFQSCDADTLLDRGSDYFRIWIWSAQQHDSQNPTSTSPITQADALAAGEETNTNDNDNEENTTQEQEQIYSRPPLHTTETSLFFPLPSEQRFNIQFGRSVMAGLLQLEARTDWKNVPMREGDEARDAAAWKRDLGRFDFAMMG